MLKKTDLDVWQRYITRLYDAPESKFTSEKTRNDEPNDLDLHGLSIQQAFNSTNQFLTRHFDVGSKTVIVITGKDGKINEEFPFWCDNLTCISKCEPLIDSRGQAGAYIITLKKNKR